MIAKGFLHSLFWTVLLILTAWLGWNIVDYYVDPARVPFFRERMHTAPPGWKELLLIHIAGGSICLLTGPVLFWKRAGRIPGVHAVLGTLYGVAALGVMIPTGFLLSLSAHGGTIGKVGFFLTALATAFTTFMGFHRLTEKNIHSHTAWMIRSYALMASALTFRLVYVTNYFLGIGYELNYPLSTWLSTLLNLGIAEAIIFYTSTQPRKWRKPHEIIYRSAHPVPQSGNGNLSARRHS